DQLALIRCRIRLAACQLIEGAIGAPQQLALPMGYVVCGYCGGGKLRNVGAARQGKLKLGYPPADLLHAYPIGCMLVAFSGCFCGQQTLLLDEAIEIGAGQGPRVALVLDESVHHGDRAALAILDQLDRSKERWNVRESNGLGKKA